MAKMKKSWREKLADSKDLPKVVEITDDMSTDGEQVPFVFQHQ